MPIISKTFNGKMNLDDNPYRMPDGDYREAFNITRDAQGQGQDIVVSGIMGNTQFPYDLPLGQNKCIGQYADKIRNRIYIFIWNSNGNHVIIYYDNTADVFDTLIINLTDTGNENVLNFNPSYRINHVNIIYREEGDLLFWTDGYNNPRKMNVLRIQNGEYGTIEDYIISVITMPPDTPPSVVYGNDGTIAINNLRKGLFQFAERYIYDDFETSVLSSFSELPLPVGILDTNTEADPTINNYIAVTVQTGHKNVAKLEILGRQSLGTTYGDWFSIIILDKAQLSIADDTTYTYNFYNESAYVTIDPTQAVQLFDTVPDIANAQELPNGNTLVYGGITEGLDLIQLSVATSVSQTAADTSDPTWSIPYYGWNSRYGFGIQYFTENGKTNGTIIAPFMNVTTLQYDFSGSTIYIPSITFSIANRPPIWASYYQLVRTKNLSQASSLMWVSNVTDKDDKYAYIGISNIAQFIAEQPVTSDVVGYTFKNGDRIQFLQIIGASTRLTNKDFAIIGEVENPAVNSTIYNGSFLKIQLPTTNSDFNFGGEAYANYLINIYTPTKPVGEGLQTYYEFGERYAIGDIGLPTRYHYGKSQNQTPNLSDTAIINVTAGDMYFRPRDIPIGIVANFTEDSGTNGDGLATIGFSFVDQSYPTTLYTFGSSPNQNLVGFNIATNTDRQIITVNTPPALLYKFRIQGVFRFELTSESTFRLYLSSNMSVETDLIPSQSFTPNVTHEVNIDKIFFMGITDVRMFILQSSVSTDSYVKTYIASDFTITDITQDVNPYIMDFNFVDTYPSAVNSNGRPSAQEPYAKTDYYPTLVRFSETYQQDTNINGTNRFYDANQDTYDRIWGDIVKLYIEKRALFVFHKFNTGVVPILTQVVRDVAGNPLEANSDILLNKITYPYSGQYGLGNVPESFVFAKGAMYGVDNNKGVVWRLSQDGQIPISIIYKTNAFFVGSLIAFKTDLNTGNPSPDEDAYTGNPSVYGVFNQYTNKYIIALEEINRYDADGILTFHQDPYTICFNETRDESEGFESFYTYYPEMQCCLNNFYVTWKNGQMWKHQPYTFLNFYGYDFDASITPVFIAPGLIKKTFLSIGQQSSYIWDCPEITTSIKSPNGNYQSSYLTTSRFNLLEGTYWASILRDINSAKGLWNGDSLKGVYLIVKFRLSGTAEFQFLNVVTVKFVESFYNPK